MDHKHEKVQCYGSLPEECTDAIAEYCDLVNKEKGGRATLASIRVCIYHTFFCFYF